MSDTLAMIAGISMPEDVDILVSTFWRYALKGDAEMMWRTVEAIGFYEEHGVEALRAIKDRLNERWPDDVKASQIQSMISESIDSTVGGRHREVFPEE